MKKSDLTAAGYDQDRSFMLVEIAGDELYFQTISRTGVKVDSGVIRRVAKIAGVALIFGEPPPAGQAPFADTAGWCRRDARYKMPATEAT